MARTVVACGPFSPISTTKRTSAPTLQAIERIVKNAVAMEIDLPAVGCLDKPAILVGEEFRHVAVVLGQVLLDAAAHLAHRILDLPLGGGERVPDRRRDVFVLLHVVMRLVDDDVLVVRHCDANIDLEWHPVPVMLGWPDDRDIAARDAAGKFLQPPRLSLDLGLDAFRRL